MEEFQMLIANMESLLSELKQAFGVGAQPTNTGVQAQAPVMQPEEKPQPQVQEQPVQPAQPAPQQKPKEEEMEEMKKSMQQTESDGVTANDDAETRLEDNIETSEENVKDVAKAVFEMIANKLDTNKANMKPVVKSETDMMAEITNALTELAKSQKQMVERQETIEKSVINIISGLGVADEITNSMQIEKSQQQESKEKGINNPEDREQLEKLLKSIVNKKDENENTMDAFGRNNYVHKKLRDVNVLKGLTGFFNK